MDAVDAVLDCVEDMESIFMEEKFTDVEVAKERVDCVIEKHRHAVVVHVRAENSLNVESGDHYYYTITAPETGAYTLAFLSPPRVYEPYESHDEDEEDDFAAFQWPSRYVTVPVVPDDIWFHVDRGDVVEVAMRPRVRDIPPEIARPFAGRRFRYLRQRGPTEFEKRRGERLVRNLEKSFLAAA